VEGTISGGSGLFHGISVQEVRAEKSYQDGSSFKSIVVSGKDSLDPTARAYECDKLVRDNVIIIDEDQGFDDINVWLPSGQKGREIFVKVGADTMASVYVKTFMDNSTIDGQDSLNISAGGGAQVICDGTVWYSISNNL
jgi:hypothetical protein